MTCAETLPQDVADANGAACLNGAPPQFELSRNESDTRWILFLEGGGWCYGATPNATKASCASRGGFVWPPKMQAVSGEASPSPNAAMASLSSGADIGGIMASDPAINPDFHTFNKVFLRYCDGSSFGGFATEPVSVSTKDGVPAQMWLRGRGNFNALISYLQLTLGMDKATEVILSGGSAGGLAVLYNLDHLRTLLPPTTRLTGFPDAGFFLDGARASDGAHSYRDAFIGADPVWNITASGGTNLACLADQKPGEAWKCLLAPYLVPYIKTPLFVMNSAYDAWQMSNILATPCVPAPNHAPCSAEQNATLRAYHDQFVEAVKSVTDGKPENGVYIDGCYVHEQNVNYCSGQMGMPNCVGWSPLESGSKKWGYRTSVAMPDGRKLTPQQAFGAYYRGDKGASVAIDSFDFFDNPSCLYRGAPVPPLPTPPPPPTPPTAPPTPAPSPKTITCDTNHTPCAAHYAVSDEGCCTMPNAICCPNQQTCCPAGTTCNDGSGVLTQCVPSPTVVPAPVPTPGKSVCKPGPQLPFSTTLKNVIVLGDSVSIGYTPHLAADLAELALVQHSPFDTRDGGAEETNYGLMCLDYFVRGPAGNLLDPDVLMFNFGLHDGPLGNATVPGQQGNSSVYGGELEQIVIALQEIFPPKTSKTKLVFLLTTPMLNNLNADGNVRNLNNQASAIMAAHGVSTIDPHTPIIEKCGTVPTPTCFGDHNCFNPHCGNDGYAWLANSTLAPPLRKMLA